MSRRVTLLTVSAAAIGLLVAAYLLLPALARPSAPQGASLTFLGFSKRRADAGNAMFCFSNGTVGPLHYYAESLEVRTEQGWQVTPLRSIPTNWFGFGICPFSTGDSYVFSVPPPTDKPWRIRLTCTQKAGGTQRVTDEFRQWEVNRAEANSGSSVKVEVFNGNRYQIVSPEVSK